MSEMTVRSVAARLFLIASLLAGFPGTAGAEWKIVDHGSPWSAKRPLRPHTRYIVLHTTEGAERGSLAKLAKDGEAHYLVGADGTVHRLVDRHRIAAHAGRSMWDGHANIDEYALGIEVVGYHSAKPNAAQISALHELLRQLQGIYQIPDERVLTHSMVAYGSPNRWHRKRHRGRKRCGMRLAEEDVRRALGLTARPRVDPDVKAGRLVVADDELFSVLFPKGGAKAPSPAKPRVAGDVVAPGRSPWDIAREDYASPHVRYIYPDGKELRGDEIEDWMHMPAGVRVVVGEVDRSNSEGFEGARVVAEDGQLDALTGDAKREATTIYLFPSGLVRTGAQLTESERFRFLLDEAPAGTRVLVGYQFGGYVTDKRPPSVICGERWSYPSTFYRFPDGEIHSGDAVDAARIPRHTLVFFRQ